MEYSEALNYLYTKFPMFSYSGATAYNPGLETSLRLAKVFHNPHRKFRAIHVGGTNGKGSVSHLIASVLQSQGYKTALYTSPHIIDFRERIKINGRMIPKPYLVEFMNLWKASDFKIRPSFFEITMIMAFKWFAEEGVDFAVIEVGLGGRLDSTNIITPVLSVITNISHDHNQILGNTLTEIAREKAGIIKKGIPVVIGESGEETDQVFISKAREAGSDIKFADKVYSNIIASDGFVMPLKGDYQKKNIATVLTSLETLKETGIELSERAIKEGIEKVIQQTGLVGRWMIIDNSPLTIVDSGHNIAGLTYNFNQLKSLIGKKPSGRLRIVLGFVADKAVDDIVGILPDKAAYYITNANIPRALSACQLLEKLREKGLKCNAYKSVVEAYEYAKKEASEKDIVFVGGSMYLIGELLRSLDLTSF